MFQSCWECIAGNRTQVDEPPISVQPNGNGYVGSRAPPWPVPRSRNEKMYLLPKQLEPQDRITINCLTYDQPNQLTFGLVTGYNTPDVSNLACQLNMNFPEDNLQIISVNQGNANVEYESSASDYYEGADFKIAFMLRNALDGGYVVNVHVGSSYLSSVPIVHDLSTIRFITVSGDVKKIVRLDFEFGDTDT